LRRWSHDEDISTIFPGSARACRAHGSGSPGGSPFAVGCDLLDSGKDRVHRRLHTHHEVTMMSAEAGRNEVAPAALGCRLGS
jgi:hypothetical protein